MRHPPRTVRRFRIIGAIAVPVYLAALILAFPLFNGWYTDAVSYVRVFIGKIAVSAGVAEKGQGIMLGVFKPEVPYAMDGLRDMQRQIGTPFDILAFYTTWGERPEDRFPIELMRAVDEHGAMGMITWEPWTTEFAANAGRGQDAVRTDLKEITAGRYDAYIRTWAQEAVVYGRPFFLRFAHEMNNPQYPWSMDAGNTPDDFIAAWRHVWNIFEEEGAANVIWVWSPKREAPRQLYPGGAYVDWIGTGVFNYGSHGEAWYSFEYLYESVYRSVIVYDKPIMIAELGCATSGGSRPAWFSEAWHKISTQYPGTDAVVLYNNPADRTLPGVQMDWSIEDDTPTLQTIATAVDNDIFQH